MRKSLYAAHSLLSRIFVVAKFLSCTTTVYRFVSSRKSKHFCRFLLAMDRTGDMLGFSHSMQGRNLPWSVKVDILRKRGAVGSKHPQHRCDHARLQESFSDCGRRLLSNRGYSRDRTCDAPAQSAGQ
jgi:hypothetical protein